MDDVMKNILLILDDETKIIIFEISTETNTPIMYISNNVFNKELYTQVYLNDSKWIYVRNSNLWDLRNVKVS